MARMWRSNKVLHCWPMWTRTSPFQHTSNAGLAAVDGGMADVLALHEVDDVLGDVGGVVANALEVFCHQDQLEGGENHAGITHHVSEQLAENLVAVVVHFIVAGENLLRDLDIAADDGVQSVAHHLFGDIAHAGKIDVRLDARMPEDALSPLGDVDGLVADALEVVV